MAFTESSPPVFGRKEADKCDGYRNASFTSYGGYHEILLYFFCLYSYMWRMGIYHHKIVQKSQKRKNSSKQHQMKIQLILYKNIEMHYSFKKHTHISFIDVLNIYIYMVFHNRRQESLHIYLTDQNCYKTWREKSRHKLFCSPIFAVLHLLHIKGTRLTNVFQSQEEICPGI